MGQGADSSEPEQHPRVCTIDGYQGCENDIIVFSATRSNAEERTGFAGDSRRMCVLLTRARSMLVVVGDATTLQHDDEWQMWLESPEKRHVFYTSGAPC